MSYAEFKILKNSGTYAEMLEVYGVAKLINEILIRNEVVGHKVIIEDKNLYYAVIPSTPITEDMIHNLSYFPLLKFIRKDDKTQVPDGILDYFDYPEQKKILDEFKDEYSKIEKNKNFSAEQKKQARKYLNNQKESEFGSRLDIEFDVYREIIKNPYSSFVKLFNNFHSNQEDFVILILEILSKYHDQISVDRDFKLEDENPTAQQLYNPFQGKGLNKNKANSASMGNLKSDWAAETMKISGAMDMMIPQYVKVGSSYDLKIYVPEFNKIGFTQAKKMLKEFKVSLKSNSPVKLDILNILDFSIKFIKKSPEYGRGKIKNTIKGFHTVYQKDLGQNKAVANISYINTPDFISYKTKEEGWGWVRTLEEQRKTIAGIEELGGSIHGLQAYRDFLGSTGNSAFNSFSKFSLWYSGFLSQELSKEKFYVRPFRINSLNKFYKNMDTQELNLTEIINDEGFQAVASAIRNSTIRLQIKSKFQETHKKFKVQYGFAQNLALKSKTKQDFVLFISEFLAKYDAETASFKEKNPNVIYRANIRKEDKDLFFNLIEKYSPSVSVIGGLLASYGFALNRYDESEESKVEKLNLEAEKLGFQLIPIEEEIEETEN